MITEPIAVTLRDGGVSKILFWYTAQVDSTSQHSGNVQKEGEDFDGTDKVKETLSFDDD